jgi:4a-hydroxytetrahydrobiopterin dehydratase
MTKAEKVYDETEIAAKLREEGLTEWYLEDGWLRRKFTTDGWPTT